MKALLRNKWITVESKLQAVQIAEAYELDSGVKLDSGYVITAEESQAILYPDSYVFENGEIREKTDDDRLKEARDKAITQIKAFAVGARDSISKGADKGKLWAYTRQASLAENIIQTDPELLEPEALESYQESLAIALDSQYAKDNEITDAKEVARIWLGKDRAALRANNAIDATEKSATSVVNSASLDQIKDLLESMKTDANTALLEFIHILDN